MLLPLRAGAFCTATATRMIAQIRRPGFGHGHGRGHPREHDAGGGYFGCASARERVADAQEGREEGGNKVAAYPAVVDISCSLLSPCLGLFLGLELGRRLDTVRRRRTKLWFLPSGLRRRRDQTDWFLASGLLELPSDIGEAAGPSRSCVLAT